jgi:hypothetical protein
MDGQAGGCEANKRPASACQRREGIHSLEREAKHGLLEQLQGSLARGEKAWTERIAEGEEQSQILREHLGESPRASRREEMMNMSLEDMEKELAESGWKPKPEDDLSVTEEELPAGIEEIERAVDANLKRSVESTGATPVTSSEGSHEEESCSLKGGLNPAAVGVSGPYGALQLSQHITAQIGAI